jgi:hypothetical protein
MSPKKQKKQSARKDAETQRKRKGCVDGSFLCVIFASLRLCVNVFLFCKDCTCKRLIDELYLIAIWLIAFSPYEDEFRSSGLWA